LPAWLRTRVARRTRFNLHMQGDAVWQQRAHQAVELWSRSEPSIWDGPPDGTLSVAELGCGNERLLGVLTERLHVPFTYQGYDLLPQAPATIRLDVERELPDRRFDVVFALGLLEYLSALESFAGRLARICRFAIVSYVVADGAEPQRREALHWRSHHARSDLEALWARAGWCARDSLLMPDGETGLWLWESQAPAHSIRA
jgi:SAM-dependent methyltransferase